MAGRVTLMAGVSSVFSGGCAMVPFVPIPVSAVSFSRAITVPVSVPVSVPVFPVPVSVPLPVIVAVPASVIVVVVGSTGFPVAWSHYLYLYIGSSSYL